MKSFEIQQELSLENFIFDLEIGSKLDEKEFRHVFSEKNMSPRTFDDVDLFISDPWSDPANVSLRNFVLNLYD